MMGLKAGLLPSKTAIAITAAVALMIVGAILFAGPAVRYFSKRAEIAEAQAEQARDDAAGRDLEAKGAEAIGSAVETHYETVTQWRDRVVVENREVYRDPEAQTPLPEGLAASAHRFDRSLCLDGRLRCRADDSASAPAVSPSGGPEGL